MQGIVTHQAWVCKVVGRFLSSVLAQITQAVQEWVISIEFPRSTQHIQTSERYISSGHTCSYVLVRRSRPFPHRERVLNLRAFRWGEGMVDYA